MLPIQAAPIDRANRALRFGVRRTAFHPGCPGFPDLPVSRRSLCRAVKLSAIPCSPLEPRRTSAREPDPQHREGAERHAAAVANGREDHCLAPAHRCVARWRRKRIDGASAVPPNGGHRRRQRDAEIGCEARPPAASSASLSLPNRTSAAPARSATVRAASRVAGSRGRRCRRPGWSPARSRGRGADFAERRPDEADEAKPRRRRRLAFRLPGRPQHRRARTADQPCRGGLAGRRTADRRQRCVWSTAPARVRRGTLDGGRNRLRYALVELRAGHACGAENRLDGAARERLHRVEGEPCQRRTKPRAAGRGRRRIVLGAGKQRIHRDDLGEAPVPSLVAKARPSARRSAGRSPFPRASAAWFMAARKMSRSSPACPAAASTRSAKPATSRPSPAAIRAAIWTESRWRSPDRRRSRSAAQITASRPAGALFRSLRSIAARSRAVASPARSASGARRDGSGVAKISVKRR